MSLPSLNNLDKSTWQALPFGEITQSIGERIDPATTDLETYVGLEHIDAESIHIKRFGKRDDVSGTKLRCYPGDVIFGRRRAYQRKAAICEFDGFCSAHSLVLRAIPEVIEPKLFPFFLHSDQFMHRAVDISVGGLSPTINWTKLKKEEFLLPPKDQQSKLAELLWAADEANEKLGNTHKSLVQVKRAVCGTYFNEYRSSNKRIEDIATKVGSGVTPKGGSKVYTESGVRFIRSQNVLRGAVDFSDVVFISPEIDEQMSGTRVHQHDVLLNITGASIGRAAAYRDTTAANVNQHVCIIRTPDLLEGEILCAFLNSTAGQVQVDQYQAGGNREGLNFSNIRRMKVPEFSETEKEIVGKRLRELNTALGTNALQKGAAAQLLKSLINQIFYPTQPY